MPLYYYFKIYYFICPYIVDTSVAKELIGISSLHVAPF